MTPLQLLTVILLSNNKQLRESVIPSEFGRLGGVIAELQADHVGTVKRVLAEEIGVEWDGTSPLAAVVAEKCRSLAATQILRDLIAERRSQLQRASLYLDHPNIAGSDGLVKAVAIIEGRE